VIWVVDICVLGSAALALELLHLHSRGARETARTKGGRVRRGEEERERRGEERRNERGEEGVRQGVRAVTMCQGCQSILLCNKEGVGGAHSGLRANRHKQH